MGRLLAGANPGPLLDQEAASRSIGLEVQSRDNLVADQHRQGEVAEHAFGLRHIGFETVLLAEEAMQPLALDHERIERRQDVDMRRKRRGTRLKYGWCRLVRNRRLALQHDGYQLFATHTRVDQAFDLWLTARLQVAD